MSILQILEEIGSDTKRTHKLNVIERNKHNQLFRNVVKLALDPYINFFIRKIPQYKTSGKNETLDWALIELEKLSSRQLTGNAGIEHLANILSSVSSDDAIVVERIIGKDLRCGIQDASINAIIDNFIPTYPCLLARSGDEKNIKNINFHNGAYVQKKSDGLRINFHVENGKVLSCGRSGRELDLLGKFDNHFKALAELLTGDYVFDGELVVVDEWNRILDRKTGNGIASKAIKGTISEKEASMIRISLWDVIPLNEFKAGKSTQTYDDRFKALDAILKCNIVDTYLSWMIETEIVNSLEEAQEFFQKMLNLGEEGAMLKNKNSLWEDSRSKDIVKMKAELTGDLEITGYNPGQGKYEGQIGSLICASSDRKVEVAISGFSEDLRKEITENIDQLMGTIVEVKYNERIKSKDKNRTNVDSLFLPRFECFRTDKLVADSSEEIK